MRIATNTVVADSLANVEADSVRYFNAEQVMTTGKQLNEPSDNPVGISQALSMQNMLDSLGQFQSNTSDAQGFVSTTVSALGNVQNLLQSARSLVVQGASSTITSGESNGLAAQIQSILTSLGQIANTQYGDQYIFAGQRTTNPPFAQSGSGYVYSGGSQATGDADVTIEVAPGSKMVVNAAGDQVFSSLFTTLQTAEQDLADSQTSQLSNSDLQNMDSALSAISSLQAAFGSKSQQLTQNTQNLTQLQTETTTQLSNLVDADIPTATINLQTAETAYQAALVGTARSFQQSLVDFIQ